MPWCSRSVSHPATDCCAWRCRTNPSSAPATSSHRGARRRRPRNSVERPPAARRAEPRDEPAPEPCGPRRRVPVRRRRRARPRTGMGRGLPVLGDPEALHDRDDGSVSGRHVRPAPRRVLRRTRTRRRCRARRCPYHRPPTRAPPDPGSPRRHGARGDPEAHRVAPVAPGRPAPRWGGRAAGSVRSPTANWRAEYRAVRERVSLMDVGTLGKFLVCGPDAERLIDHVAPCRVDDLEPGRSRYLLALGEAGLRRRRRHGVPARGRVLPDVDVGRCRSYGRLVAGLGRSSGRATPHRRSDGAAGRDPGGRPACARRACRRLGRGRSVPRCVPVPRPSRGDDRGGGVSGDPRGVRGGAGVRVASPTPAGTRAVACVDAGGRSLRPRRRTDSTRSNSSGWRRATSTWVRTRCPTTRPPSWACRGRSRWTSPRSSARSRWNGWRRCRWNGAWSGFGSTGSRGEVS